MRELTQIDSVDEHDCDEPQIERWNVLEPVSGHWSWLTVFRCCARVSAELSDEDSADDIQKAA